MTTPFVNGRQASVTDLLGQSKQQSDLVSHQVRVRYTESTTVQAGRFFRLIFPKRSGDQMLDCRSIRLKFNLRITSTDLDASIGAPDVRAIFNRIRILSGTTVIHDLAEAGLAFNLETLCSVSHMDSKYDRRVEGVTLLEPPTYYYADGDEFILPICPKGGLLNSETLLPTSRMSDLIWECYLEQPQRCMFANTDPNATFSIENVEILCDYIQSPSISNFFNTHGVKFHCTDVATRFNSVLSQEHVLRLSSSHSSLNGILTAYRIASEVTDIAKANKFSSFLAGTQRERYNVLVNNSLMYEQDIDSLPMSWGFMKDLLPLTQFSIWFDDFTGSKNLLATSIISAPPEFRDRIISGINTSQLNSDITYRVRLTSQPTVPLRTDSFLYSDIWVFLPRANSDLQVKF